MSCLLNISTLGSKLRSSVAYPRCKAPLLHSTLPGLLSKRFLSCAVVLRASGVIKNGKPSESLQHLSPKWETFILRSCYDFGSIMHLGWLMARQSFCLSDIDTVEWQTVTVLSVVQCMKCNLFSFFPQFTFEFGSPIMLAVFSKWGAGGGGGEVGKAGCKIDD